MPTISPSLVPTITPGNIFSRLTTDTTLNVRWLTATDPAYFETLNRPHADIVLRQLILAKAIDALNLSLGHDSNYPFLVNPQVASGTQAVDIPPSWIWDIQMSLPQKWENVRLAKIKRIAGENVSSNSYTGYLRLIFTANVENSSTEVAIFGADYHIDSTITYQLSRLSVLTSVEETTVISPGEIETVAGFINFRTLDMNDSIVQNFYNTCEPPTDLTDSDNDDYYDNPAVYEIVDSVAGGANVTDDFSLSIASHGTGYLTESSWNAIPQLDSDVQSWINSFNYPFDSNANRISVDNITIPLGLFREFNICAPAGDQPTGDTTGTYFPVWISRIERTGTGDNQLKVYFATYNVTDTASGGNPSTVAVEFATLDLLETYSSGEVVDIVPIENLQLETGDDWQQHFGRGHVVLSSLWDGTTTDIADWFNTFDLIAVSPADTSYTLSSTRISSFGISRVPKYTPTIGQSRALKGSTSRRTTAVAPSYDNRYVTELDQGLGNQVDLEAVAGVVPHVAIDRYGYAGSLCHVVFKMVIDATQLGSDASFYDDEVLPRIQALLGRDPQFGDIWYDGTRFKTFNGDSWQS